MPGSSQSSSDTTGTGSWLQWILLGAGGLFFVAAIVIAVGIPTLPFGGELAADGGAASPATAAETTQSPVTSDGTAVSPTTNQSDSDTATTTEGSETTQTPSSTPSGSGNKSANSTSAQSKAVYRINVGGPQIGSTNGSAWSADVADNPSPYLNAQRSNTVAQFTPDNVTTEGSVPPAVPNAVFKTYRFEQGGNSGETEPMTWRFPVDPTREYEVRIYVSEPFFTEDDTGREYEKPYSEGGPRTFGISINDETVLENYEPFKEHGHDVGAMKSFEVTAENGAIEIQFLREVENPTVSGIEIVETGPREETTN